MTENNRIRSREEKIAKARQFTLMSDVFMSVALRDIPACQHVLRILTGVQDLKVTEVRTQYTIPKVVSHDARLDVLAEDSSGKLYNIEIQRTNTIDHARRTRFYGAMIDSEFLAKGKSYDQLPDVHIIYISEQDLWKANRTVYSARRMFEGIDVPYDDGIYISYINTAVNDGTEIAALMQFFTKADPYDTSQGDLSKRIHFLKCEEGGGDIMCEIAEQFIREGREEGRQIGREEGRQVGREEGRQVGREEGRQVGREEGRIEGEKIANIATARKMLEKGSFTCKEIAELTNLTIEEIEALMKEQPA